MGTRQSEIITISVPPGVAREYRRLARSMKASASALFREMFERYRHEQLKDQLTHLQAYGSGRAAEKGITEREIERLVFGDR
jgi:hypothetical protein